MTVTNTFKEAVSNCNIKGIRIMMKDSMRIDTSFEEYDEMARLAAGVSGLYDPHDGREFENDATTWDDNYMDKLMVQVVSNFSKERLEHLKAVMKYLRPSAPRAQTKTSQSINAGRTNDRSRLHSLPRQNENYQEQKRRDQQNGSFREVKIASGAVAGAVVGGVIATAASVTVLGGVAIGAVAGGVAAAVITKGK